MKTGKFDDLAKKKLGDRHDGVVELVKEEAKKIEKISDVPFYCPVCGAHGTVIVKKGPYAGKYNKVDVKIDDIESCHCSACGEEFFTKDQSEALSRAVKLAAGHMEAK